MIDARTDCHCHILPGLDDGAGSMEESVALALFQRNVGSLEGLYGEAVSVRCEALLAEGLYDTIGTDLHNERYADFFDSFGFKA